MTVLARLLVAGVAVLFVGACATPSKQRDAESARLVAAQEYANALRATAAGYTWPADRRPDIDKVIRDSQPPDDAVAQAGLATLVPAIVNACAWYLSWSDAFQQGRTEQAGKALRVLSAELPLAKVDPESVETVKQIAARAQAGDAEPAIGYAEANCDNVRWVEIPGG